MDEFEQLTSLLGGNDTNRLSRLERRLDDAYQRSQEMAAILPAALRTLPDQADFISALQSSVDTCLKESLLADPHSFVKAILPVEMPVLRKIVANALKQTHASLQTHKTQLNQIKVSISQLEKIQGEHNRQLNYLVKRFDELEQKNTNQFKQLKDSLSRQLDDLESYFEQLEKAHVNQLVQLDNINKLMDSRFDKALAEQQAQSRLLNKQIKGAFQKLKIEIDTVSQQVNHFEQTQEVNQLVKRSEKLEQAIEHCNELANRIADPSKRTRDVASVLPDAIRLAAAGSIESPSIVADSIESQVVVYEEKELADSLKEPVEFCIQQSISQDAQNFANALFPVMGPAIRKSINETFKVIVQRINHTLEESFSPKGLAWRLQSLRTGQPFSDIVLQNTLIYQVEQVFLIHKDTGLLIQHLHQENIEIGDSDAVSAMFTAIQDFIRDSFVGSDADQKNLNTVEMGERTVWLEHGPYAVLACVIRGNAPMSFRNVMQTLLENMHAHHGSLLQQFSGDSQSLQSCIPLLQKAIQVKKKLETTNWRLQLIRLGGVLIVVSLPLLVWGYYSFKHQQRLTEYINVLHDTPGIMVASSEKRDGKLVIYGLRDPLADEPQRIAGRFELDDDVVFKEKAYQDLNPKFVEIRLQRWLKPPNTVQMFLKGTILYLKGYADQVWIDKVNSSVGIMAGFTQVITDELVNTQMQFQVYVKALNDAPGIIVLSSHVKNGEQLVTGMRDPLAEAPEKIAKRMQISNVVMRWSPYQDLTPLFVEKRARLRLGPPSTVSLRLQGDILYLSGYAPQAWIDKAINSINMVAGINQLEINELMNIDQFLLAKAETQLIPPDNVSLIVHNQILKVKGYVDSVTFQGLQERIAQFQESQTELAGIEMSELVNVELEIRHLIQRIEKKVIYFAQGSTGLNSEQKTALQKLHIDMQKLQKFLLFNQNLHQAIRLQIIGNTDGIGTELYNRQLGLKRASIVYNGLNAHGMKKDQMEMTLPSKVRFGATEPNPRYRNVSFRVIMRMKNE